MANQNAVLEKNENFEDIDFDSLDVKLQEELESQIGELEFLEQQKAQIGSPEALGTVVLNTVWEQFTNQIAIQAGEDFIKDNGNMKLDLSEDAHVLSAENFEKGELPEHNRKNIEKYQKRYDETRADFQTDPNRDVKMSKNMRYNEETKTYERYDKDTGTWIGKTRYDEKTKTWEDYNPRNKKWEKKLAEGARNKFDTRTKDEKGSKTVNKDHVISAAEQIRDNEAATYMDREERQEFAKSDVNIQDLDNRANVSKNDLTTEEWLNETREDGTSQAEYFGVDEEELRQNDKKAREAYAKEKEEAKKRAIEEGRQSQKDETFRIGKKALRAIVMNLLADLVKKIIQKFIAWLKSAEKNLKTLLEYIKNAIIEFIVGLKNNVVNVADTAITVIATSIIGPVVSTIKKAWMFIKQGWSSLKEAVDYLKNPENKGKSVEILLMEVGKIITAGLTAAGAIVLSEAIEAGLTGIAIFNIEIPMFGTLANIIGMFLGAVVSGIIGALAINLLNDLIAKKQKEEINIEKVKKGNEILATTEQIESVAIAKTEKQKEETIEHIVERHKAAGKVMGETAKKIKENSEIVYENIDNSESFREIDYRLGKMNYQE